MSNTHVVVVSFLLGLLAPGTWAADTAGPPAPEPLIIHGQPGLGAPTTSDLPDVADLGAYAPDRILVKFRRRTSPTAGTPVGGHKVLRHPAAQGRRMRSELTPGQSAILSAIGGRISRGFQRTGWLVVDVDVSVGNAIERLYASGEVLYAEPDYVGRARDIPNDTFFDEQWALNNTGQDIGDDPGGTNDADIDAPEGWDDRDHARSVIAVIIDSGVDYEHEDLADNMWRNPDEQPGNGIDDDGNGYIDDIFGVNTIAGAPTTDPMDDNQHGTHVAGIVGAVGDNGTGITGVAREVRLVAVKWLGADNTGFASDVIAALDYVLDMFGSGQNDYPRVILNNSWGFDGFEPASLRDSVQATRDAGLLFVASAGNSNANADGILDFPSGYSIDNILNVGASDFNDMRSSFSNYGCEMVDVFAPGTKIASTVPDDGYRFLNGTSMAAPLVSGIAALIWSKYPNDNYQLIKNAVVNGVEQSSAFKGIALSQGRVNLASSLKPSRRTMPTIGALVPTFVRPGGEIVVRGSQFGDTRGELRFIGTSLPVQSWSDTEIRATVPNDVDLTTGHIRVTSAAGRYGQTGACMRTGFGATRIGQTIVPHGRHATAQSGRKLWMLGGIGFDSSPTRLVERYDIVTGQSTIESKWFLPLPVYNATAAIAAGGIHVVGGIDGDSFLTTDAHQVFELATGRWSQAAPLPSRLSLPSAGAVGGKLYVFGGFAPGQALPTDAVSIYDPQANEWTAGKPVPMPVGGATVVKLPSGRLRLIGGFSENNLATGTTYVQEYIPQSDSWLQRTEMAMARGGAAGALVSGEMAVLHGISRTDGELFRRGRWRPAFVGQQPLFLPSLAVRGKDIFIAAGSEMVLQNGTVIFRGYRQNIYRTTLD